MCACLRCRLPNLGPPFGNGGSMESVTLDGWKGASVRARCPSMPPSMVSTGGEESGFPERSAAMNSPARRPQAALST